MDLPGSRYITSANEDVALWIKTTLLTLDYEETLEFYNTFRQVFTGDEHYDTWALLGCNDRYFLLTCILNREDALHPWLFDRCREVEREPDGHLDLWARFHFKSSIITFAGAIQEIMRDPEITIGIFAATNVIAKPFLVQIQQEFESNDKLKNIYHDVLYANPKKEAPAWSREDGIRVKRTGNPKENTVEAYGLIEGLPTGRHFRLLIYDDLVTERLARQPEQIKKCTEQWELSAPLGVGEHTRRWHIGTRYSFGDTYGIILDRKVLKPRIYPATDNGRREGRPVMMTQTGWDKIKVEMASQLAAQMLQNPTEGEEATFSIKWLRPYFERPLHLNVYIMVDPSAGKNRESSDNTAMAVIGVDTLGNKYLLDGYRHKMRLPQRWQKLRGLYNKWSRAPGVQMVRVGYERYGKDSDIEHFQSEMEREDYYFEIEELAYPREGNKHSKTDRIQRLQPDMELGRFYLPGYVWHELNALDEDARRGAQIEGRPAPRKTYVEWRVDEEQEQLKFRVVPSPTQVEQNLKMIGQPYRAVQPIQRLTEGTERQIYDLTRAFIEECRFHPFAPKDDLIDAVSRIYDMDPKPALPHEADEIETPNYPD